MGENRFLAIDQGNSLIKLTLLIDGEPKEMRRFTMDALEELFSVVESWKPTCGVFCSVGKIDIRMVESLRLALGGNLLIFSRSTRVPVKIDYFTSFSLGLDRIALAVGAAMLYKEEDLMVVDAGTAVTLDVVDWKPTIRGGRISPGLRLRFESLHSHTAALPLLNAEGEIPILGESTETSIRSGVVMGLSNEIVETFKQYKENYGCQRLVLTGGDAAVLAECIGTRVPVEHVPYLMAMGLYHIYNYNEIED